MGEQHEGQQQQHEGLVEGLVEAPALPGEAGLSGYMPRTAGAQLIWYCSSHSTSCSSTPWYENT